MESETFKMRKQFLEDFYNEDRVNFLSTCKVIAVGDFTAHNRSFISNFYIDTEAYFKKSYINSHIPFENYHKLLKPFIYFLYSFTYQEKFLRDSILCFNHVKISYQNDNNLNEEEGYFNASLTFPSLHDDYEGFNFLNKIKINDYTKGIRKIFIKLLTVYHNINYDQYITLGGIIEEDITDETNENITREIKIINSSQTFKSEECVICLTNPPNVLFCNCGHQCYCSECEKLKNSNKCPICKTENRIIRVLE